MPNQSFTTWPAIKKFREKQKEQDALQSHPTIEEWSPNDHNPKEYVGDTDHENSYITKRKEAGIQSAMIRESLVPDTSIIEWAYYDGELITREVPFSVESYMKRMCRGNFLATELWFKSPPHYFPGSIEKVALGVYDQHDDKVVVFPYCNLTYAMDNEDNIKRALEAFPVTWFAVQGIKKVARRGWQTVFPDEDIHTRPRVDEGSVYDATVEVLMDVIEPLLKTSVLNRTSVLYLHVEQFNTEGQIVEGSMEYQVHLEVPTLRRRARIFITIPIRDGAAQSPESFQNSLRQVFPISVEGLMKMMEADGTSEPVGSQGFSLSPYGTSGVATSSLRKRSSIEQLAMNIDMSRIHTLWYENEDGDVWVPDMKGDCPQEPPGFIYQFSCFPTMVNETVLRITQKDEVDACPHDDEYVQATYGWIDGTEGRECKMCGGTQLRYSEKDWPSRWDAEGSKEFMTMSSSYPEDLVLRMANSGDFSLQDSILVSARACERCLNVLGDRYGLEWGFKEGSKEWKETNTECDFCKGMDND